MKSRQVVFRLLGCLLMMIAVAIFAWIIWLEWGTSLVASSQQDQTVSDIREELDSTEMRKELDSIESQQDQMREELELLEDPVIKTESSQAAPTRSDPSTSSLTAKSGEAFGVITASKLGKDFAAPLLQSTDTETLKHGVGHYMSTADPCSIGNFSLAGHRTTYGRPFYDIDKLQPGDEISIETLSGSCVYKVDSHKIVDPSDVSVIAPVPNRPGVDPTEAWLTMTACHPKYSDLKRYVVFARLIEAN